MSSFRYTQFSRLRWRLSQVWLCLVAVFIVSFFIYFQVQLHLPLKGTWTSSTILLEQSNPKSHIRINHPLLDERAKTLPRQRDLEVETPLSSSAVPLTTSTSKGDALKKKNYIQKVIKQAIKLWEAEIRTYPGVDPPQKAFSGQVLPVQKIRRVLIVSSWRSGSSFLGEILSSYPGTFYSFEPLHYYFQLGAVDKEESIPKSIGLLKDLLTCNFSPYEMYGDYLKNHSFLMRRNEIAWTTCSFMWNLCFDNDFLQGLCQILPLNLIKTVRIGLEPIESLLKDPSLDLRVIYLIRDPRGSLHSRKRLKWCVLDVCWDPATVCNNLLTDLNVAEKYSRKYPGRFLLVRYEDLSLKPEKMTKDILKFADLPFHPSMKVFLKQHTKLGPEVNETLLGPYSTFRDSQSVIFAWRNNLTFNQVENIQKPCGKVLKKLRLYSFKTQEEYHNQQISVLT